jgi:nitrile hydratase accessory protein
MADPGAPGGPAFSEPWQAEAFSLTVSLHRRGLFTWTEWTETLGREIAAAPEEEYYLRWLAALERIVAEKGLTSAAELETRRAAWDRAARATPHGQPIVLPTTG